MQHASVKKLFKEQVQQYSHKDQYKHSPLKKLALEWLKHHQVRNVRVCEFGGGAGQLLSELQHIYPSGRYTNVEIISDYQKFQESKNIHFVVGSVLDSGFADNSFHVILMRDVLHHLVGRNYTETKRNQRLALDEIRRLLKPGGIAIIEELTNTSFIATRIVYYLTRINSIIGIHVPRLQVSSHIIVSFLTAPILADLCTAVFGRKNIKQDTLHLCTPWYISVLHILGTIEKTIISAQKNRI
jgi:ubiquinone/menaquinone biosynthesis C-methylase UbiE